jgi:hypothetical protein
MFEAELHAAIKTAEGLKDPQGYWTYEFDDDGLPIDGYCSDFVEGSTLRGDQYADAISLQAYKDLLKAVKVHKNRFS